MAQRRMFSPKIVGSDIFLEMPTSSRELYFQLGMYADDDGFINPKKIIRMVGASEDDLKILIAKRFVLSFEDGVIVIKHWPTNNLIRKDWYQETNYKQHKNRLKHNENGDYTEAVNNSLTNRQHSIGKDSIGNNILTPQEISKTFFESLENKKKFPDFVSYWTEPNKSGTKQRWELERTFDVTRRLATWQKNQETWNKHKNFEKPDYSPRPELKNWTQERIDEEQRTEAQKKIDALKNKKPIKSI